MRKNELLKSEETTEFMQGSIWRKWDLHVHSPLTILNNQYPRLSDGSPDWERFIAKLESVDAAVVGITDYFSIEGYKIVREYKKKGRLRSINTILPNIEFRLDKVLASRKDGANPRRLNFHVIFSDEIDPKDIEEHFLDNIEFFFEGNPQDQDGREKLKQSNLEALGRHLKEQHAPFRESGDSDLKVGAMQAVVSHEKITEVLSNARFRGKFVLIFPEEFSNLISWDGQDHHTRKGILQKSDMVFSSNEQTSAWCLGRSPYAEGAAQFMKEFKTLKPCVHGSDAHKLAEIGNPCALRRSGDHDCEEHHAACVPRFCWIKADATFEGLKQLLYEPDERVRIQQDDPTPVRTNFTIETVALTPATINRDLAIQGVTIPLNGGLVAVTGSRGSGKTAFVDVIANCYQDRSSGDDRNSFVWRVADDKPKLRTVLTFRDKHQFSKDLLDGTFFEDSELVYIAQGELERYIDDKSDFEQHVRRLILENPEVQNSVKAFEYDELRGRVDTIHRQMEAVNDRIAALEAKTGAAATQAIALEKKQKEADLKDVRARVDEVEKVLNPERVREAQDKQQTLTELQTRKDALLALQEALQGAMDFIATDLVAFSRLLLAIRSGYAKLGITEALDDLRYSDKDKLAGRLQTVKEELPAVVKRIEEVQKGLERHAAEVRDHAKLLGRRTELEKLVAAIKVKEDSLAANKEALSKAVEGRRTILRSQLQAAIDQAAKYQEVIGLFSERKADMLGDLTFEAGITFDVERFLQSAEDILDNRKIKVIPDEGGASEFSTLFVIARDIPKDGAVAIDRYVAEIERLTHLCRSKLKRSQAITATHFFNFILGDYLTVAAAVKYKKTELRKLSMGQKATVLIKIHLSQGDKPIIIDSHDDHLDNEFIMEELVHTLRYAKRYRQIILASNNGNVVINSDAEQIIIARRNSEGVISYVAGAIENPKIRDAAVRVLEGGETAFRKRQQKYRLT